ncbi:putative ABC transport system permease protein [Sphingomonas naasensis]|uniref:FtsX-like permease family protein n=1 Tax=Sphingomonas naasensis TaxID=1344951 RepID=A0A4S1WMR8_9SPHN|nr:ABC transporter permease [Sphingomonas naasensis]NIJ20747.1 putative ABC transport system permease protein [Sphingomonas naasensis]TGX43160.1 FtsX-like permease family protein [Sphingomonas naasensis]
MWRNYVTVGLRALGKNKVYAFINIFGLSLGIAVCLLILTFVRYEFSYDSWMPGAERAYQLQDFYKPTERGGEEMKLQVSSIASGEALVKDFPQIEKKVYLTTAPMVVLQNGQPSTPERGLLADGNIFEVLQVPFVRGDRETALDDLHSVALSESEAKKYFGNANPVGKTLTISYGEKREDFRVTGVFEDLPKNSHLRMSMVARFEPHEFFQPSEFTSWNNQNGFIYLKLREGANVKDIMDQLPAWEKRNIPDDTGDGPKSNPGDYQDWRLTNVRDVHLGEAQHAAITTGSDKQTMITFVVVALMILGMACVNFTNLATARASQRAREVALRKVLGATRRQLIIQFLGESILVAGIAMLVGLAMAELALPLLNNFLDASMEIHYLGGAGILLPVLVLALIVGLAGGVYPAIYLSRFQPARVLKANKSSADAEGNGRLRNLLVVAQFAVSIGLIICTAIVYSQTIYARTMDAGYKREGLFQVYNLRDPQADKVAKTLEEEVGKIPGVTAVGRTTIAVNPGNNSMTSAKRPGQTTPTQLGTYGMDPGVVDALGMRLLAGRGFSESIPTDDSWTPTPTDLAAEKALVARGTNLILSESAAKRLGFASAQDAVGKPILAGFTSDEVGGYVPATIVGVVSDVRYRSIRQPLQPIMYFYQRQGYNQLLVRFTGDPQQIRAQVEAIWKRLVPETPFQGRFVTDIVKTLYQADETRAQLFGMFAILAVVIGCLGLFGLAAFTAERRTKEIGIRKVLGARTRDIVRLLVWQFSRPVLIANLIAWPIAWWVMRDWLNQFDIRIALTPTPFVIAGALALGIAVATIVAHAFRVARTNPVYALRYE